MLHSYFKDVYRRVGWGLGWAFVFVLRMRSRFALPSPGFGDIHTNCQVLFSEENIFTLARLCKIDTS